MESRATASVDGVPVPERTAIVEVKDLYKSYGKIEAVRWVSFDVYSGEVFGLLGPNGAGKTTTIEMIAGLLPIGRGLVRVQGIDVGRDRAKRTIKALSGGEQQRFGIAVALVNDPIVLFLDEPTTGLDARARRNLWETIRSLRQAGRSIVLTTHYIEEAEILCDRVAIMEEGCIVALDTPASLIQQLLDKGFRKPVVVPQASLEDVFLDLTGRRLDRPGGIV